MGLGKYFYTRKNEGSRLTAAEERFFQIKSENKPAPKKEDEPPEDIKAILDGLLE